MSNKQSGRYVPIKRYCEMSGLSYATVNHMLKSGQLKFITTESGLRRIDTQDSICTDHILVKRLDEQERMLKALCGHLGLQ